MEGGKYMIGVYIVGFLSFLCIWIYSFISWGFLIGLMFGWLPALIGGFLFSFLWPIVLLLIVILLFIIFN
jgi:hypothetical protein